MYKEYNYDLNTGELVSVSIQNSPLITTSNGYYIIYNKRTPDGKFVERYGKPIAEEDNEIFYSYDEDWNINHSYVRRVGEYEYGCNIKGIRSDGRVYYAQNGCIQANLFPNGDSIQELIDLHADKKIVELIYVEKDVGRQIYIICKE